jgi:hypothetical protein
VQPSSLSPADREALARCTLRPVEGRPTWRAVFLHGTLIGYVTERFVGQFFRTPDMPDWLPAADDWPQDDPPFARATLRLLSRAGM